MYRQVKFLPPPIEAHIVCESTENLDQFHLPRIHSFAEQPAWRSFLDRGLRKLGFRDYLGYQVFEAQRYQAQILHSHFGNRGWEDRKAAKRACLKHVVTFYGYDVSYLPQEYPEWHERYQDLFEHVDRVLCEGKHMADSVIRLGCPAQKVQVQHLGVEVDKIAYSPRVWQPGTPLRVLIAASFREKKGIPYALKALVRIRNIVDLDITIIGDANNEPRNQEEKQKILATLKRYNLESQTRLLGYQPYNVFFEEAYRHHIFLSPSVTASDGDTEGGAPVSLIDMASSGMPIVSSRHCDIPEVIQDGMTGLLADERDVDGLVDHLTWLIEHPDDWQPMIEAGRKRMETEYNARRQGGRLAEIYTAMNKPS
jgi:colanic acid/amylovoran biosynthesis glycosyltransferase